MNMKRLLLGGLCLYVVIVGVAHAATITYTGTGADLTLTPTWAGGNGTTVSLVPTAADNNTVTIEYSNGVGTRPHNVYGGVSNTVSVTGNTVLLKQGDVYNKTFGGYANGVGLNASKNSVSLAGNLEAWTLIGGYSEHGSADQNAVTMSDGKANSIRGAEAAAGASGNSVTLSGGTVYMGIDGAFVTTSGAVSDNWVKMTGGTVGDYITGARTSGSGDIVGNWVEISAGQVGDGTGGTTNGWVTAGYATAGDVSDNEIRFSGGVVNNISTGESENGNANSNRTIITGGEVRGEITRAAWSDNGSVTGNSIEMSGGKVHGNMYGAQSNNGNALNNRVVFSGGELRGASITGGSTDGAGNANGNSVLVSGGILGTAATGTSIIGGFSQDGDAKDNQVTIHGGTRINSVVGGQVEGGGAASGNHIEIAGGTYNAQTKIIGGLSTNNAGTGFGNAIDNTITLSGQADLSGVTILGGESGGAADAFTGNSLNIAGFSGNVESIANFENYNFSLSESLSPGQTILNITGTEAVDLSNTNITITDLKTGEIWIPGTTVVLIDKTENLPDTINGTTIRQGMFLEYEFQIDAASGALVARVQSVQAHQSSKSLSEGRAASLAFIRQGHDFIVDSGFAAANAFLGRTDAGWSGPSFFGAAGGGHFRHKTGSHVDIDGVSTMFGLAWRNNAPCGSLLLGAFFEAGYGDYDTRNTFTSGAVRGDGDSRYFGGGFMARYDWQNGFYAEASARVGGLRNKFNSDLTDGLGNSAKYTLNSAYFGAHAGVGYKWQLSEKTILNMSAKYLWSRQNSDSAIVAGDKVDFDVDSSHRVRTGMRFAYAINDCISPYAGAAFEYEFKGKARASAYGYDFGAPSLKGGTGIGEIGVTMRRGNFSADLGVQGHVGRREGVSGSLQLGWQF